MKLFPKILLIIGFLLLIICAAIPNNYSECHSDMSIAGYSPRPCLPDVAYQFDEVAFYVAVICIFAAFTLNIENVGEFQTISIFDKK